MSPGGKLQRRNVHHTGLKELIAIREPKKKKERKANVEEILTSA